MFVSFCMLLLEEACVKSFPSEFGLASIAHMMHIAYVSGFEEKACSERF